MAKYNITSSGQLIDIATITNGCTQIETAAERFAECAKLVLSASNICNADALSVDKTTMQPQLEYDAEYISNMQTDITNFTMLIKNVAAQIYAEQKAELAYYIAQQQVAANNNNSNSTSNNNSNNKSNNNSNSNSTSNNNSNSTSNIYDYKIVSL